MVFELFDWKECNDAREWIRSRELAGDAVFVNDDGTDSLNPFAGPSLKVVLAAAKAYPDFEKCLYNRLVDATTSIKVKGFLSQCRD